MIDERFKTAPSLYGLLVVCILFIMCCTPLSMKKHTCHACLEERGLLFIHRRSSVGYMVVDGQHLMAIEPTPCPQAPTWRKCIVDKIHFG